MSSGDAYNCGRDSATDFAFSKFSLNALHFCFQRKVGIYQNASYFMDVYSMGRVVKGRKER